jgi:hypothetical protein
MPGCLGLDALWQLVGFHLGWLGALGRGRALGVGEVKFTDQVLPTVKQVVYGKHELALTHALDVDAVDDLLDGRQHLIGELHLADARGRWPAHLRGERPARGALPRLRSARPARFGGFFAPNRTSAPHDGSCC